MTFYYHMYSEEPANMGTLNVYVKNVHSGMVKQLFSVSGSQGNEWKTKSLNLPGRKKLARYQVCWSNIILNN